MNQTDNQLLQEIASLRAEIAACWLKSQRRRAEVLNVRLNKVERQAMECPSLAHLFGGLQDVTG